MVVKDLLSYAIENYPEVLKSVTVVRAPWLTTQFWKAVSPFMQPEFRNKFHFAGPNFEKDIINHAGLSLETLPQFLGGNASDSEICQTLRVPSGTGATMTVPDFNTFIDRA